MKRSELVDLLNLLPDIEVGSDEGTVVNAEESTYDTDEQSGIPYIYLHIEEE